MRFRTQQGPRVIKAAESELRTEVTRGWGRAGGLEIRGDGVSVRAEEKVPELAGGVGCPAAGMCCTPLAICRVVRTARVTVRGLQLARWKRRNLQALWVTGDRAGEREELFHFICIEHLLQDAGGRRQATANSAFLRNASDFQWRRGGEGLWGSWELGHPWVTPCTR